MYTCKVLYDSEALICTLRIFFPTIRYLHTFLSIRRPRSCACTVKHARPIYHISFWWDRKVFNLSSKFCLCYILESRKHCINITLNAETAQMVLKIESFYNWVFFFFSFLCVNDYQNKFKLDWIKYLWPNKIVFRSSRTLLDNLVQSFHLFFGLCCVAI